MKPSIYFKNVDVMSKSSLTLIGQTFKYTRTVAVIVVKLNINICEFIKQSRSFLSRPDIDTINNPSFLLSLHNIVSIVLQCEYNYGGGGS